MKQLYFLLLLLMPLSTQAQAVSFTASTDTVCQDSCITFINTSIGAVDSITWVIQGVTLSNPHDDTINACFPLIGIDTVKLYVYDSGNIDSFVYKVTIAPRPHPMVVDSMTCAVPGVYLSYQWYSYGGYLMPGQTSAHCGSCGMGLFYVVVDSGGCSGRSNYCNKPEGVNTLSSKDHEIKLYPNPAYSQLTVSSADRVTAVAICNLIGQTIFTQEFNSLQVEVDVSELPEGVYLIRVNGTEVRKLVKQ